MEGTVIEYLFLFVPFLFTMFSFSYYFALSLFIIVQECLE